MALGAILLVITLTLAPLSLGPWSLSPGLPLLGIYALLLAISLRESVQARRRGQLQDPYYDPHRSAAKLLHETLPNLLAPAYLLALATTYHPINGLLLLAFLFWRLVLGSADWRWPLHAARQWLNHERL